MTYPVHTCVFHDGKCAICYKSEHEPEMSLDTRLAMIVVKLGKVEALLGEIRDKVSLCGTQVSKTHQTIQDPFSNGWTFAAFIMLTFLFITKLFSL